MVAMAMGVMVIMATTAREKLSQLLLLKLMLKLMLNQDIIIKVTVAMDMEVTVIMGTMARERLSQLPLLKLMLSQDIIIMATDTLMVDTAIMVTMARGRQRLPLDTIIMDILM